MDENAAPTPAPTTSRQGREVAGREAVGDVAAIIPSYNHAHYLDRTIQSVLNQTVRPKEIVVVDDGSTDNTAEVLKPYVRAGVLRHIVQENAGASVARNRGIRETTARFVAFLDSDDQWLPRKTEQALAAFSRRPELGMVSCPAIIDDGRGGSMLPCSFSTSDVFLELLCRGNVLGGSASSAVIRRDALELVGGFDPRYRVCQDWDLWMRVARRFPAECVKEPGTIYRVVAGSNSMSQRVEVMEANLRELLTELFQDPTLADPYRRLEGAVWAHEFVVTAKSYFGQRKWLKGIRALATAARRSPTRTAHAWFKSREDTARLDPQLRPPNETTRGP